MARKVHFTEDEKYGLTHEEVKMGIAYLRKHKTAGRIPQNEAMKLYELYMIGHSMNELHQHFPQYPIGRIVLTAALSHWAKDRDTTQHTLKERVQAKVIKSVVEQVDFLTAMLSVSNSEHLDAMRRYILDPANNPKPDLRIGSIKDYREVAETLYKLVAGTTTGGGTKASPMMSALISAKAPPQSLDPKKEPEEEEPGHDVADFIAGQLDDGKKQ